MLKIVGMVGEYCMEFLGESVQCIEIAEKVESVVM